MIDRTSIKRIVERELKLLSEESKYIGSCVDVGKNSAPVCQYFTDATELSNIVDNPNKHKQVSKDVFFNFVDREDLPKEALDGEKLYYAVTYSPVPGESLDVEESGLFYLYNLDKDVHYFFER